MKQNREAVDEDMRRKCGVRSGLKGGILGVSKQGREVLNYDNDINQQVYQQEQKQVKEFSELVAPQTPFELDLNLKISAGVDLFQQKIERAMENLDVYEGGKMKVLQDLVEITTLLIPYNAIMNLVTQRGISYNNKQLYGNTIVAVEPLLLSLSMSFRNVINMIFYDVGFNQGKETTRAEYEHVAKLILSYAGVLLMHDNIKNTSFRPISMQDVHHKFNELLRTEFTGKFMHNIIAHSLSYTTMGRRLGTEEAQMNAKTKLLKAELGRNLSPNEILQIQQQYNQPYLLGSDIRLDPATLDARDDALEGKKEDDMLQSSSSSSSSSEDDDKDKPRLPGLTRYKPQVSEKKEEAVKFIQDAQRRKDANEEVARRRAANEEVARRRAAKTAKDASDIILDEKKQRVSIKRNQKKYLKELISKKDEDDDKKKPDPIPGAVKVIQDARRRTDANEEVARRRASRASRPATYESVDDWFDRVINQTGKGRSRPRTRRQQKPQQFNPDMQFDDDRNNMFTDQISKKKITKVPV